MSSAANHRARSRRSFARHRSALNGVERMRVTRSLHARGGPGAPLVFRFKAFRMWLRERVRRKDREEAGA